MASRSSLRLASSPSVSYAVGISGIIAWGLGAVAGKAFVAGDPPGVTYTTAGAAATSSNTSPTHEAPAAAATTHHFDEVVWYRLRPGCGGAVLLALAWTRRRRQPHELQPETFVPTVAAAVFGIVGIWLIGQGVDNVILKTTVEAAVTSRAVSSPSSSPVVHHPDLQSVDDPGAAQRHGIAKTADRQICVLGAAFSHSG